MAGPPSGSAIGGSVGSGQGCLGSLWSWLISRFSFELHYAPKDTAEIKVDVKHLGPVNSSLVTVLMCEQSYQAYEKLYTEEPFQPSDTDSPSLVNDQGCEYIEHPVNNEYPQRSIEIMGEVVDEVK